MTKTTKAEASSTKSQPRFSSTHARAVPLAEPRPEGVTKPHTRKARATTAEMPKTTRSREPDRSAMARGGGATAGCGAACAPPLPVESAGVPLGVLVTGVVRRRLRRLSVQLDGGAAAPPPKDGAGRTARVVHARARRT